MTIGYNKPLYVQPFGHRRAPAKAPKAGQLDLLGRRPA